MKSSKDTLLARMQDKGQLVQDAAKPLLEIMDRYGIRELKITVEETTCAIELKANDCER